MLYSGRLATGVHVLFHGANLARDLAAPLEATVAVHLRLGGARLVAATAAQQIATFHAWRGAVALAARCTQRTRRLVRCAVVG